MRPALAEAPSLFVIPSTERAASSAFKAISRKTAGAISFPSSLSISGAAPCISNSFGAKPAQRSSGASRAIATALSTKASKASFEKSEEETLAERCPINNLSPISAPSERPTSSSCPKRTEISWDCPWTKTTSAASAPA